MLKKIAILAMMALAIWAAATLWPTRTAKETAEPKLAWPVPAQSEIASVRLETPDAGFVLVVRDGQWFVDLPGAETDPKADKAKVMAFLEFLVLNKPVGRLEQGNGLAAYGLEEPRARVVINGHVEITIGVDAPDQSGVYATAKGESRIIVLPQEYLAKLTRKPKFYFDMRLFSFQEEDIRTMALAAWEGEAWKVRADDGSFVFEEPKEKAGNPVLRREADLFLHTILSARATDLLMEEPPGPLDERVKLTLAAKGGQETMTVYSAGESLVARSDHQPLPFKLDPDLKGKLVKTAFELSDRRVLSLDIGGISRIRIFRDGRELVAERVDKAWRAANGEQGELLGLDMNLWRLTDLNYESEPVQDRPDTARQVLTLTLWGNKAEPMAELHFYADSQLPEGLCWIATSGEGLYYPVSARLYKDLESLLPLAGAGNQAS